jgi:acetyltransferase
MKYPADWQRTAHTLDGVEYRIRPILATDEQLEHDFIVGLSPESRYKRMMCAMREPSAEMLRRFVHVDYQRDMAFVAIAGVPPVEHIIGVARYAADAKGSGGEFAVAVADEWQSRGVGATLMQLLLDYARTHGIHDLHGEILSTNSRMVELAHWLGMRTHLCERDASVTEASREL